MNNIKKLFAVMFAAMAVLLISTAVFADAYGFIVQPEGGSTVSGTKYTVTWTTTFTPQKVIIREGNTIRSTITATSQTMSAELAPNILINNGRYYYYIDAYYSNTEYVTSTGFLITEIEPAFEISPQSEVLGSAGSKTVYWETNFTPVKQYLLRNGTQYQPLVVAATSASVETSDQVYKIRAFYTNTEYVESAPFQITSTPRFTMQPSTVYGFPNMLKSAYYDVNFYPVKVTIVDQNGNESSPFEERTYNYSIYSDKRYVYANPSEQREWKIRAYYSLDGYLKSLESSAFKILPRSMAFTAQPTGGSAALGSEYTVNWATNFTQEKVEVLRGDEVYKSYTGDVKNTALPPSAAPYKIRSWWNASGQASYYSIESNEFYITPASAPAFTLQPSSRAAYDGTSQISLTTNFTTTRLELYEDGVFKEELNKTANSGVKLYVDIKPNANYGTDRYHIRAYWGDGQTDYIDSSKFGAYYSGIITYASNGSTAEMPSYCFAIGYTATISKCDFTPPEGKMFKCWTYNSKEYWPGDKFKVTGDMTFTAVWSDACIVSFDKNGGSGSNMDPMTIAGGSRQELPECTFTAPTNTGFYKWRVNGNLYSAGEKVAINENTVVYATWYVKEVRKTVTAPSMGLVPNHTMKDADVMLYGEPVKFEDYTIVLDSNYGDDIGILYNDPFEMGKAYTFNAYLSVNDEKYYYSDDTVFRINGEKAVLDKTKSSIKSAVIRYIFPKLVYKLIPFDSTSTFAVSGTLHIDKTAAEVVLEEAADNSDSALEAFISNDWHYDWYADGKLVKANGGTSFKVPYDCSGKIVYAVLVIGDQTAKSEEAPIPTYYYTGDIDHDGYITDKDAAYLLKYLSDTCDLTENQKKAAKATDSTKSEPDMIDVIWILNHKTA